uniref:G-protein coupled receptors family 1 profile domain-containing protein n=1 Tax=Plectus sambesii TaxID=2011161 RepID=A0A914V918_9BILA
MATQNATTYFSYLSKSSYIILQSLYLPIGCSSIVGNSIVLLSYFKFKQVRSIDCALLIVALALSDLICGVGAIIIGLARLETAVLNDFNYSRFFCIFSAVPNIIGIEMSQVMTMAVAIDRLLAVSSPLTYRKSNHRLYAAVSFLIALLSGGVILLMSVVGFDFNKQPSRCSWTSGVHTISVNIFVGSNALAGPIVAVIYAVVVYKQRKWNTQNVAGRMDQSTKKFLANQAKMTSILTKLVIIYCTLVAVPLTTMELWTILDISPVFTSNVLSPLRNIAMSLNSAVNVLVYAHSSSNLRPFLLRLLCGKRVAAACAPATRVTAAPHHTMPINSPTNGL